MREGLEVCFALGLDVDLLELGDDALIVDRLAAQAREHLQAFLVALLGGEVPGCLRADERKEKDNP